MSIFVVSDIKDVDAKPCLLPLVICDITATLGLVTL